MHLDLTDEEAAALTQELHGIVQNDGYPFSHRIRTLRGILNKLRPEPLRERFAAAEGLRASIERPISATRLAASVTNVLFCFSVVREKANCNDTTRIRG
jgi:hypothetical protein